MKKYTTYKDSGVEWLGKIPELWEILPNKHIFKLKKNLVGRKSAEYVLLSLTLKGIIQRVIEDGGKFPAEFDTYQEVNIGDFVFCLFDVEETPRCVGLSNFEGMITGAYAVLEVKPGFDKGFLYYFYLNLDTDKRMRPLYTGLRNTISKDNFFAFKSFIPPLPEQTAIATYLDEKTAKIDLAITQKEKLIALLKERKQIIIQNAVTKGLNPNVKMKNSGVEWIGEIPEHWEVKNLRYAFLFLNYRRVPLSAVERESMQGDYPYYGASGIIDFVNDFIFDEKTILIAEDGANLLSKSSPLAFEASGKYWVNNHAHILKPKFIGFRFWAELLSLIDYTIYISGAAQPKLTRENLGAVKVIVPPIEEIDPIIAYIEKQSINLGKAINLQEQQIDKLKEYKATLIDSAVTGKIKIN